MVRPSAATVWRWLEEVPDPEIPAISIVDLGIVRDVVWQGGTLVVAVTPTYSGCPATAAINLEVGNHLRSKGLSDFRLERRLSPPWTTDWLSEKGKGRLLAFGIAPPVAPGNAIACPQCASSDTEKISQFGSTPCKSSYRCRACLEPFEHFKCI